MKRFLLIISLLSAFFVNDAVGACTGSSPRWTSTPDYTSVASCVSQASAGDTINVNAGSASWSSTLSVTKQISLIGAGIGSTVITNTGTGYLISYGPGNNNNLFRVSGFSFNLNNVTGINLAGGTTNPPMKMIRIDNNRFYNSTVSGAAIKNANAWGVIDHNTFDTMRYPIRVGWGYWDGQWNWNNLPELVYGGDDSMFVENNTFANVEIAASDQDLGGRYVFRYNSFSSSASRYPWLDIHGGKAATSRSGMGGEVYGNTYSQGGYLMSHRGGRLAMHHNQGSGSYHPYNADGCPYTTKEKLNSTYVFQNRVTATGNFIGLSNGGSTCVPNTDTVENLSFWVSKTGFNGTVGVGAGTLANRPATCTMGVGYWATNQSTTDLTGMIGVNPSTPITGTLYKCTATNIWTAYYTPYTYPHPLTTGEPPPPSPSLKEPNTPLDLKIN